MSSLTTPSSSSSSSETILPGDQKEQLNLLIQEQLKTHVNNVIAKLKPLISNAKVEVMSVAVIKRGKAPEVVSEATRGLKSLPKNQGAN